MSYTPLFQVLFALQNATGQSPKFSGFQLRPERVETGTAIFDLVLDIEEQSEGLRVTLQYNTELFEGATATRLLAHYQRVLEGFIADPKQSITQIALLGDDERHKLLVEWNPPRVEYGGRPGLAELFEEVVEREPAALALVYGGERVSYEELNARANQLAHYLREQGVGAETLVGVYLERSVELVVALLAVVKAGGAYVPLDPLYPSERLSFILEEAKTPLVLTTERLARALPAGPGRPVWVDREQEVIRAQCRDNPARAVEREQLVYVLYTSGSTGQPKGVAVTHGGLVNYLNWAKAAYLREAGQGAPVHSPIGFDLTVTSLYLPLVSGQSVLLLPEEPGVEALLETVRQRPDFSLVKLTPAHLQLLSEQAPPDTVREWSRTLVIGGEALLAEHISFWRMQAPGVRLINEYGPTETVVGCAVYEVTSETPTTGNIPIGRAIGNTELYLLDERLEPVPVGAVGELYIGGDGLARGYLNRPDLTAERFVPHPYGRQGGERLYRTGDMAKWRANGEVEFVGRADGQVKVRGYRIELGEIQAVLMQHPAVSECVVIAREDVPGDKRLAAYVKSKMQSEISASELRSFLEERLPAYMIPTAFVVLGEFPLTANGKLDIRALPVPDQAESQTGVPHLAPRTPVEEMLAETWAKVLNVEGIGVYDNFFRLGGHSLLATQVV
ncbi:MAG TPA: amino acid adenylation domain-containing protein, partial [Chloroflexia bacterium]|nr:amino acid adenylation domain-containing protein [Chloroflexia bacterium]